LEALDDLDTSLDVLLEELGVVDGPVSGILTGIDGSTDDVLSNVDSGVEGTSSIEEFFIDGFSVVFEGSEGSNGLGNIDSNTYILGDFLWVGNSPVDGFLTSLFNVVEGTLPIEEFNFFSVGFFKSNHSSDGTSDLNTGHNFLGVLSNPGDGFLSSSFDFLTDILDGVTNILEAKEFSFFSGGFFVSSEGSSKSDTGGNNLRVLDGPLSSTLTSVNDVGESEKFSFFGVFRFFESSEGSSNSDTGGNNLRVLDGPLSSTLTSVNDVGESEKFSFFRLSKTSKRSDALDDAYTSLDALSGLLGVLDGPCGSLGTGLDSGVPGVFTSLTAVFQAPCQSKSSSASAFWFLAK